MPRRVGSVRQSHALDQRSTRARNGVGSSANDREHRSSPTLRIVTRGAPTHQSPPSRRGHAAEVDDVVGKGERQSRVRSARGNRAGRWQRRERTGVEIRRRTAALRRDAVQLDLRSAADRRHHDAVRHGDRPAESRQAERLSSARRRTAGRRVLDGRARTAIRSSSCPADPASRRSMRRSASCSRRRPDRLCCATTRSSRSTAAATRPFPTARRPTSARSCSSRARGVSSPSSRSTIRWCVARRSCARTASIRRTSRRCRRSRTSPTSPARSA